MKNDLRVLAETLEKKFGKVHNPCEKPNKTHVLHKVWEILKGKEKPSLQTLNRLALLAGFQSWDDFQDALHGTGDGLVNYSSGE